MLEFITKWIRKLLGERPDSEREQRASGDGNIQVTESDHVRIDARIDIRDRERSSDSASDRDSSG